MLICDGAQGWGVGIFLLRDGSTSVFFMQN